MLCERCGTKLPDDSEFCPLCGARVPARTAAGGTGAAQGSRAYPDWSGAPGPLPVRQMREEKPGDRTANILIAIAAAFLLILFGIEDVFSLVILIPSAGVLFLILHTGLKMRGREFVIALTVTHKALIYIVIFGYGFVIGHIGMDNTRLIVAVCAVALTLFPLQIVLVFLFYIRKSRGLLLAVLIPDLLILLFFIVSGLLDVFSLIIVCLAVWQGFALYPMLDYLIRFRERQTGCTSCQPRSGSSESSSGVHDPSGETPEETARRRRIFQSQRLFDADFGLSAENPVSAASVRDMGCYLAALRTEDGRAFTWERRAANIPCFEGYADAYALLLDSEEYKTIYINHFGLNTQEVPRGLTLSSDAWDAAREGMPYALYMEKKAKREREQREAEEKRTRQRVKSKRVLKRAGVLTAIVLLLAAISLVSVKLAFPAIKYQIAVSAMEKENYEKAMQYFVALDDYRDSKYLGRECTYEYACDLLETGDYLSAWELFSNISFYADSEDKINACMYGYAGQLAANGDYELAADLYKDLGSYQDAKTLLEKCYVNLGNECYAAQEYKLAADYYDLAGLKPFDNENYVECCYQLMLYYISIEDWDSAYQEWSVIREYKDVVMYSGEILEHYIWEYSRG